VPEIPDLTVYLEGLERFVVGRRVLGVRVASPFVVRTFEPRLSVVEGREVERVERLGKRLVLGFEGDHWVALHLMIAGRLRWRKTGAPLARKVGLCAFDFEHGSLVFTEASPKKRASLHVFASREGLLQLDAGGLEPLRATAAQFEERLRMENHTLKRSLTDPRLFAGIGNAYSDEILHRAGLSPVKWTSRLSEAEVEALFAATQQVLQEWIARLRTQVGERFPDKVTAFHPEMAVHGRYGLPCPACDNAVQRIRRADNEVNYCPGCQTGGKLLADRGLSRLLKGDWPKTLEELEDYKATRREVR